MANRIVRSCVFAMCLLFVFSSHAFAVPVTDRVAENVGAAFFKVQEAVERIALERRDLAGDALLKYEGHGISNVRELKNEGTGDLLAYVFALEPKGFVAVSPDTDITPIIAYSFDGDFNWVDSKDNALLHMLRYDMQQRVEMIPVTPQVIKDSNYDLWAKYFFKDADFLKDMMESATYGPLLSTMWQQSSPYNNYCPMDPDTGKRSIVGCVATAMAMIVNYFQCTKSVTFASADNYTTETRKIAINATTANISSITYPITSDDMKAKLSYACGVSVQMDYTSSSSGAYTSAVAAALKSKFGFNSATWYNSDVAGFYTKLQDNMKNGKPAELSIRDPEDNGHAIVCDGYNSSTGQFHLNYGWGSSQSGDLSTWWYTLPSGMYAGYNVVSGGVLDIACGGQPSCPDLYSWNGESYDLAGPLFLGTHSPQSEWHQKRRMMGRVKPQGNELVFKIKEIDGEESFINSATILYSFKWEPTDKPWMPLPLISAVHSRLGDVSGPLKEQDDMRVHTVPGDEIILRYGIPHPDLRAWLFESGPLELEFMGWSTGYYLWQNGSWCEAWTLYPEVSVQPGDRVLLDATINNMTTQDLPESAEVWFVLNNDAGSRRIGPVSVSGLPPAMQTWVTYDWQAPQDLAPGVYACSPRVYVGDTDMTWDDQKLPPKNAPFMTIPPEASRCRD